MSELLSASARSGEVNHIKDDLMQRLAPLKKRHKRIKGWSSNFGITAFVSLAGGLALTLLSTLPEALSLIELDLPGATSAVTNPTTGVITDAPDSAMMLIKLGDSILFKLIAGTMILVGIMSGIARQSVHSFLFGVLGGMMILNMSDVVSALLGIEAPDSEVEFVSEPREAPKIQSLIENERWDELISVLQEQQNRSPDSRMLEAQVEYEQGDLERSVQIVQQHDLSTEFPSRSWFIESQYLKENPEYQLTNSAQEFYESRINRREFAKKLYNVGYLSLLLFGALAIAAWPLRRNVRVIEDWLKPNQMGDNKPDSGGAEK
jgi:conjugal transfer pilus assembly protein TraA